MKHKLDREEQETIIRGYAASKTWEVVTADPVWMRYMESRGYKPDDRKNPWGYKSYTIHSRPIIPKKDRPPKSEAQIAAGVKGLEKLRASQGVGNKGIETKTE